MPEYLAPGVYIEEIDAGPKPIEGVSTSTAGLVGRTVRGPATGLPQLVTSFADFRRRYGGYLPDTSNGDHFLPHAVRGFFENGGKRAYVMRVVGTGALAATATPPVGIRTRLTQTLLPAGTTATLRSLRGVAFGQNITFTQLRNGVTTSHSTTIAGYNPALSQVTLAAGPPVGMDFEAPLTRVDLDVTTGASPLIVALPAPLVVITAADQGSWGNAMQIQVSHTSRARADVISLSEFVPASGNFDVALLTTVNGFYVGAVVEFDLGSDNAAANRVYGRVTAIQGNSIVFDPPLAAATDLDPNAGTTTTIARTCEFGLTVTYDGVTESYGTLTLNNATPFFYEDVINDSSSFIQVSGGSATSADPFQFPAGTDGLNFALINGADGSTPTDQQYVGVDLGPGNRTGLQALTDRDVVSIVAVPGITTQTVQNAIITHCESLLDRFAILDPVYNGQPLDDIQAQRGQFDTKYAAIYFPNLRANDPLTGSEIALPPSGHMAGIYARTDIEVGVHKAPANAVVRGITRFDLNITKGEQDILNPANINVLRDFRLSNRGLRVWGARCLTSDSAWKYVPVRRLFIFVEESLDEGLQWVVFEPNAPPLWARVVQSVTAFLVSVWRAGALFGVKQEEAFFVRCDQTTMTQDDIDNGRLIVLVGIAPVKPAEFVIVRIQQYTAEANVAA